MYSFHSSVEEKNKLLFTLTQYGIETTVDRSAKKTRIQDWIQASVITEVLEDEEEEEDTEEEDRQKERKAMEGKRQDRHKTDKETVANTSLSSSQWNNHREGRRKFLSEIHCCLRMETTMVRDADGMLQERCQLRCSCLHTSAMNIISRDYYKWDILLQTLARKQHSILCLLQRTFKCVQLFALDWPRLKYRRTLSYLMTNS